MHKLKMPAIAKVISKWREWPQCANGNCTAQSFVQTMSKRLTRLRLNEDWYCSPDCFENGARKKIVELRATHKQEKPQSLRMPLGLLLVSRGLLTHEQLKTALDQHRATGVSFGDIVQDLGFATQQHVTAAVAAQWACSVFSLGDRQLPAEIHIPKCLLEHYEMLPVHFSDIGRRLMVGFVTRVQHHMLYTVEQLTSCNVTPCFISATEYRKHMQSMAQLETKNDLLFEGNNSVSEIAKLVRNYACQSGSEGARFGMCRDHLWVRILGRHEMDLVFRLQNQ